MQEVFRKSYIDCLNIEKRKNPTCWSVSTLISFSVQLARKEKSHPNRDGFFVLVWHSDNGLEEGGDGKAAS